MVLSCIHSPQTADYLEATVYSKEQAVVMVGNFADLPPGEEHKVRHLRAQLEYAAQGRVVPRSAMTSESRAMRVCC